MGRFETSKKIVHTSFAEGSLLQTWFLVNALIVLGCKNLHINIIGGAMATKSVPDIVKNIEDEKRREKFSGKLSNDDVAELFKSYLPDNQNIIVKAYSYGYEYILDSSAPESHSFDMIDAREEPSTESFLMLLAKYEDPHSFEWSNYYSLLEFKGRGCYLYFSHHTPTEIRCHATPEGKNLADRVNNELKQIKGTGLSRKEIIKLLQKKFKNEGEKFLAMSAPMDFEEIIERKGIDDPIIYEAYGARVRKHLKGYVPDISLYIENRKAKEERWYFK